MNPMSRSRVRVMSPVKLLITTIVHNEPKRRVNTAPGSEALALDRHTVKVLCECYIGPVPPYPSILLVVHR